MFDYTASSHGLKQRPLRERFPEPVGVVGRVLRLLCFWKDFVAGAVRTGWGGREGGREGVPWRKAVEREEDGVGRKEGGGVCG